MTKATFCCALFLLMGTHAFSQQLMHSIGANLSALYGKIETPYSSGSFAMQISHFSYFPRYTLTEGENTSFSIGMPMGAGINILTNNFGDGGISWGFDLPLVADYNIGCRSTLDNEKSVGGYFGAGFSYLYTSYQLNGGEGSTLKNYGPLGRAGIRFSSGEGKWHTTVGLFYKIGLEKEKLKAVGFNVYFDF